MEKIYVESEARFKIERLCDTHHPQEVGGYLLGATIESDIIVKDIFPVPNTSDSRQSQYKEHSWGNYWSDLYSKTIDLSRLGKFHSHPNGTIPSAGDMQACPELHLWVIHHSRGEHTYRASRNYRDREVLLLNEPRELVKPRFIGDSFQLGTVMIDDLGRLKIDQLSESLMELKGETRRILLIAWRNVDHGRVNLDRVAHQSGRTKSTVRKHLNRCLKKGLLTKGWRRGDYKVVSS